MPAKVSAPRKRRRKDLKELLDYLLTDQAKLARASGCTRQHVNLVIRGRRVPSPLLMAKWARVLRVGPKRIARCVKESLRRAHELGDAEP